MPCARFNTHNPMREPAIDDPLEVEIDLIPLLEMVKDRDKVRCIEIMHGTIMEEGVIGAIDEDSVMVGERRLSLARIMEGKQIV